MSTAMGGAGARVTATLAAGEEILLGDLHRVPGDALPVRDDVEPYLSALLQAEHLNVLVGAGLTVGLAQAVGLDVVADMNAHLVFEDAAIGSAIEDAAARSASSSNRGAPNIEDRLRIAISAAEGLGYVSDPRAPKIAASVSDGLESLRSSVAATEAALASSLDVLAGGGMSLRALLVTFLGSFAGRTPTRDRLHVFTTNYDRVIEWGAELAGLRVVDRFVGSLEPVFRSSRLEIDFHYSPPGTVRDPRHLDGVLRLTKLHGSLDWKWDSAQRRVVRVPLPFGATSDVSPSDLVVFPNAAKDVETTFYPYADLFRDYSAALCRPHTVLVAYGYSFGDEHINRVIRDMLTIPSTHLLIVGYDDETGRAAQFASDHRRLGQVSLMIGPAFGSITQLVDEWLPWPSAEFLLQRRARVARDRSVGGGAGLSTASPESATGAAGT